MRRDVPAARPHTLDPAAGPEAAEAPGAASQRRSVQALAPSPQQRTPAFHTDVPPAATPAQPPAPQQPVRQPVRQPLEAPERVESAEADDELFISAIGTRWRASVAPRGKGADYDNARRHFRLPTMTDWVDRMRADPLVFTRVLSDLFRETRAQAERQAGQARIGRRPKVIEGSLSELWEMITPQYSNEPFHASVRQLMGDMTVAEFCKLTGLTRPRFEAMLQGEGVDMWRLEMISRALDISPAYFAEWRISYVLTLIEELLTLQPGLGIRYTKALQKAVATASKRRTPAAVPKSPRRELVAS